MPLYDYQCKLCQTKTTVFRKMVEEEAFPLCTCCGMPQQRIFNAAGLDFQEKGIFPYVDHNLGHEPVLVQSRRQWKQEMKDRGLRPFEPSKDAAALYRDRNRRFY